MKKIKMSLKDTDGILDFHFDTEGEVGEYEKNRLIHSMEIIFDELLKTGLYDIQSFIFEISDDKPKKSPRKKNRKNGLFIQHYKDVHEGFDTFYSWNGCRSMNGHSKYLLNEFEKENGVIEYLTCSGYVIQTINFEIRTIKKFY